MERYRAFLLLSFLGGCTQASAPCPTAPRIHEAVVLIATIMPPDASPVSYQHEFASMPACEAAKLELRSEMDGAIVRAKNVVLNARPSQQGWTDYRGFYRSIVTANDHAYPDLVAICADHGVASGDTEQTSGLARLPSSGESSHDAAEPKTGDTPPVVLEPVPPRPPVSMIVTPIPQTPAPPPPHRW